MKMKYEIIENAALRVLRLDAELLQLNTCIFMFRIHDKIEVINEPTALEDIGQGHVLSNSRVLLFPYNSYPLSFERVLDSSIKAMSLFEPDNCNLIHEIISRYFHSSFMCSFTVDPTRPKTVLVIEIYRTHCVHADLPEKMFTKEYSEESFTEYSGDYKDNLVKLLKDKRGDYFDTVQDEDYSEIDLKSIWWTLYCDLKKLYGYQLSTVSHEGRLSEVKPAIKLTVAVDDDEEDQCHICSEKFCEGEMVVEMPCSHILHKECALSCLPRRDSCPVCEAECKTQIQICSYF